ncbi:SDR family oxidoreductase [Haloferula luteola]
MPVMKSDSKVVLVTGASSGIGEATVRLLAERGHRLVMGARRADRLSALADEVRSAGGEVEFTPLDVTDLGSMQSFVDLALEKYGRVDVIVNNAGVMPLSPLEALKVEEWNQMIDVNLRGVLHGIATALPVMKRQRSGQIINVSSTAGHRVWPSSAVYSATKHAVVALSEGLRQENPDIRVTILSPGATQSELAKTITHAETAEFVDRFREVAIPAEAIACAISFAIEQPADVDVSEMIVRPTASSN